MSRLFSAMALLCLFSIIGCAEFKSEPEKAPTVQVTAQNLPEFVQVQVQPSNKPEKYVVYFSWPALDQPHKIRIQVNEASTSVDSSQRSFSHEVDHNQELIYNFSVLSQDSKIRKTFSKITKVPRDLVVREGQNEFLEDSKLNIQRLYISNVPLRTLGRNIEIQTQDLFAENGQIETFTENAKAKAGENGRNGGQLTIKAKSAHGKLKVFMRGENGGDGIKGVPFPSRASDGAAPGEGKETCDCFKCPQSPIRKILTIADHTISRPRCYCIEQGSDGSSGSPGAKGNMGGRGGSGGNSGLLKIEIAEASGFEIETDSAIGLGGMAGDGGDGQPGGIAPGKAGKVCPGNTGANGTDGPKGDAGPAGLDGHTESICIYIASEGRNECR